MGWSDTKRDPINCRWCGKKFVPSCNRNVFCSVQCSHKNSENRKRMERESKKNRKSNQELIVDVAKEAKARGLSYGQYVALMYQKG